MEDKIEELMRGVDIPDTARPGLIKYAKQLADLYTSSDGEKSEVVYYNRIDAVAKDFKFRLKMNVDYVKECYENLLPLDRKNVHSRRGG